MASFEFRARNWWLLQVARAAVLGLSACGGGDAPAPEPQLHVELVQSGTYIRCDNAPWPAVQLVRTVGTAQSSEPIACPSERVLAGDYTLSQWSLQRQRAKDPTPQTLATTSTLLPNPVVRALSERFLALPSAALASAGVASSLQLELLAADGKVLKSTEAALEIALGSLPASAASTETVWRWRATSGNAEFMSASAAAAGIDETDLEIWGALAVGDTNGDQVSEFLGMTSTPSGFVPVGYGALGLGALTQDRDFRDVRLVDLDNDGHDDVVANVYGSGCALIGLWRAPGVYDFSTPLRSDGSCIGGNGETLLVADFDRDGLPDIVLPSYQRFDYLKNLGDGRFEEIADSLGISFPNYLPHVEGAAAVDLDLDGDVDIVIANEVLLNDGTGGFTQMPSPFGPERVLDEGMSVADIDGDGIYDIAKNHPDLGPRVFWGAGDRVHFDDAGWLLGGAPVLGSSFGLAIGHWSGGDLPDLVFAGGLPAGQPPNVCIQPAARQFECFEDFVPVRPDAWQDLLLITDLDADGSVELVSRYGTVRRYAGAPPKAHVFRIDLRDAAGRRNQHGRSMRASCAVDGSSLGLRFVDGGNGYMAQGDYVVPFGSSWCSTIWVDVATNDGLRRFGPLSAGTHVLRVGA